MKKTKDERFSELESELNGIIAEKKDTYSSFSNCYRPYVNSAKLKVWVSRVKKLLEDSYGKESDFYTDFIKASEQGFYSTNYEILIDYQKPVFDAAKVDLKYSQQLSREKSDQEYLEIIEHLCSKFHIFVRQLQHRYDDRQTIDINDEYDVQDIFHALLKMYFDDVRPEEYTPSYAGSSTRVDFLLKKEQIVIEIKKTRNSLKSKELGNQLLLDIAHYQVHPDCRSLVCFVYDPEGKIANPIGVENDLEKKPSNIKIKVIISPK